MNNLYALLTGINNYHPDASIPSLQGCLNDITRLEDFLTTSFPADRRNIQVLKEDKATYAEVSRGFGKDHLLKAGEGDIVLFAYSGHGSREPIR